MSGRPTLFLLRLFFGADLVDYRENRASTPATSNHGVFKMDILSTVAATQLARYWYGNGDEHRPTPPRTGERFLPLIGKLGLGAIALTAAIVQIRLLGWA